MQERSYPFLKCQRREEPFVEQMPLHKSAYLCHHYESLTYWKKRFEQLDVEHGDITTYAGRAALPFEDAEGLRMILLNQ